VVLFVSKIPSNVFLNSYSGRLFVECFQVPKIKFKKPSPTDFSAQG